MPCHVLYTFHTYKMKVFAKLETSLKLGWNCGVRDCAVASLPSSALQRSPTSTCSKRSPTSASQGSDPCKACEVDRVLWRLRMSDLFPLIRFISTYTVTDVRHASVNHAKLRWKLWRLWTCYGKLTAICPAKVMYISTSIVKQKRFEYPVSTLNYMWHKISKCKIWSMHVTYYVYHSLCM